MDAQHIPPVAHYAQIEQSRSQRGGLVIVRPRSPESSTSPSAMPSSGDEGPVLPVVVQARSISEGRAAARDMALAEAATKGIEGLPALRGESFGDGLYSGLFEFPLTGAARGGFPGDAVSEAPVDPEPLHPDRPRLSRPAWLLVVPVEGGRDGRSTWGRGTPWSRSWLAPARQSGMRVVAITGDADDRDRVTDQVLSDPSDPRLREAALSLARKYGAPAVALVRMDAERGSVVRAWLWRGGDTFTGDRPSEPTPERARAAALLLLADLAEGQGRVGGDVEGDDEIGSDPNAHQDRPTSTARVAVFRQAVDGTIQFVLRLEGADPGDAETAAATVRWARGATVRAVRVEPDGVTVTGGWSGGLDQAGFERALAAAGLRLAR